MCVIGRQRDNCLLHVQRHVKIQLESVRQLSVHLPSRKGCGTHPEAFFPSLRRHPSNRVSFNNLVPSSFCICQVLYQAMAMRL